MDLTDEIFSTARGIRDPAALRAYLDDACGRATALRNEIETLLRDADAADAFFAGTAPVHGCLAAAPLPGTVIGRYRLLAKIGEGGMGVVFRAEQREPVTRNVALKIIKAGMDTQQVIARFAAERQALALMDHPNIARVLDGGATAQDRPYFVMDLVEGLPITQFCDRAGLSVRDRLALFLDVCAAIQHAHQKGIIHRDIKPSNILVAPPIAGSKPVPKVIDFGIAKATLEPLLPQTLVTQFQQFLGTPEYMSPEQAGLSSVSAGDIDTRSDLYSLGVLLYELLTGTTPFAPAHSTHGSLNDLRRIICETEPLRPSARLRALSDSDCSAVASRRATDGPHLIQAVRGDLDWIVMKCLEKDRARRYATPNGLATDLQRHLSNETVIARPPSRLYRLHKAARRNRASFIAGGAALAALVLGLAVSTTLLFRARKAELLQSSLRAKAEQAEQAKTEELARSYLAQARVARQTLQADRRERSLAAVRLATSFGASRELRDEAIAALALPALGPPRTWLDFPVTTDWPRSLWPVPDSELRCYAIVTPGNDISIRQMVDRREVCRIPGAGRGVGSMMFNRDGSTLTVRSHDGPIRIWSLSSTQLVWEQTVSPDLGGSIDLSPDGRWLAAGNRRSTEEYEIRFFALTNPKLAATNANPRKAPALVVPFPPQGIKFDASGERLLVRDATRWQIWEVQTGRMLRSQAHLSPHLTELAWHPDGRTIGGGGGNGEIFLWDVASGHQRTLRAHEALVTAVFFHPRGDIVGSRSWDGSTRFSDVHTGQALLATDQGFGLGFSADGERLSLYTDTADLGVWPVTNSRVFRSLTSVPAVEQPLSQLAFSPDGLVLAWPDLEGFRWLELASGEIQARRAAGIQWLCFDPDGSSILTAGRELTRWPVRRASSRSHTRLEVGSPIHVATAAEGGYDYATVSPAGEPFVSDRRAWSLGVGTDRARTFRHSSQVRPFRAAISPDKRWVALGQWHGGTMVCEAATGRIAHEWPLEINAMVGFTPDGRWLVTGTGAAYKYWNTSTWQEDKAYSRQLASRAHGLLAFSKDARFMAIARTGSLIQLVNPQTGEVLAELTPPTLQGLAGLALSQDGGFLAGSGKQGIHLWDLRALRAELALLGLDWDLPPLPASRVSLARTMFYANAVPRPAIPPRPADLHPQSIDLTAHYTVPLTETWQNSKNNLASLSPGRHVFDGITYDVRGSIHLQCPSLIRFPPVVSGIRIDQCFRRMHFLGGIGFIPKTGEIIATNRLHYADGATADIPIIAGRDLANWWYRPDESTDGLDVVWTGTNAAASASGYQIRLVHGVWTNPRADIAVTQIDILTAGSSASPFIVAMTVE